MKRILLFVAAAVMLAAVPSVPKASITTSVVEPSPSLCLVCHRPSRVWAVRSTCGNGASEFVCPKCMGVLLKTVESKMIVTDETNAPPPVQVAIAVDSSCPLSSVSPLYFNGSTAIPTTGSITVDTLTRSQ